MKPGEENTLKNKYHAEKKEGMPRRRVLKALAGIPVLGFLGVQVLKKIELR
jgi:hypothetical protein